MDGKDIRNLRVINDSEGVLLTGETEVLSRWKEYETYE